MSSSFIYRVQSESEGRETEAIHNLSVIVYPYLTKHFWPFCATAKIYNLQSLKYPFTLWLLVWVNNFLCLILLICVTYLAINYAIYELNSFSMKWTLTDILCIVACWINRQLWAPWWLSSHWLPVSVAQETAGITKHKFHSIQIEPVGKFISP